MSTALIPAPPPDLIPTPLFASSPKAARRFVEFFIAQINNDHTRRAYLNATRRFGDWCAEHGLVQLAAVQPARAAYGEAAPGRAADAVRLAGDRPRSWRLTRPTRCAARNTW
jgi:hypothetical protein